MVLSNPCTENDRKAINMFPLKQIFCQRKLLKVSRFYNNLYNAKMLAYGLYIYKYELYGIFPTI